MLTSIKISIIIPVYKVEPYIAECVQSVMRQTYQGDIECILVDDCGADNSIEIAEKLIAAYKGPVKFSILHHEHNRGLSAARNTGVDAASGDYVYFLDSDDYISDDCIEVLAEPLRKYQYDMVLGAIERFSSQIRKKILRHPTGAIMSKTDIVEAFYVEKCLYDAACNKLWKKSLTTTNDLTFLEGQLHEDDLWMYKCCMCMQSIYVQDQTTYYYRITEGSITQTKTLNIDKRVQSMYETTKYVLIHPIDIDKDLWNNVVADYIYVFVQIIGGASDYIEQYKSLRERINYDPLNVYFRGRLPWKLLKKQFHLVLPPRLGFAYMKWRNRIKRCIK